MKFSRHAVLVVAVVAAGAAVVQRPAQAYKEFLDEFKKVYTPDESKPFFKEVETAKCLVCHGEKSKKERNAYGSALDKLLTKAPDYNSARYDLVLTLVDLHKHQRARACLCARAHHRGTYK